MITCGIEHGVALVLLQAMVVGLGMDPTMIGLGLGYWTVPHVVIP